MRRIIRVRSLSSVAFFLALTVPLMPVLFVSALLLSPPTAAAQSDWQRGDVNSDKKINIADPISLLNYKFGGGPAPKCTPAANANADSKVDISDAIVILTYLFLSPIELKPLTAEEIAECDQPAVTVVRRGTLNDVSEPSHGVMGEVEELSDHTLRISKFHYDGAGAPKVLVHLTRNSGFDNVGVDISPDLVRANPYVNETLVYPIPEDVTDDMFRYVAIWCDRVPLTFGFARLNDSP